MTHEAVPLDLHRGLRPEDAPLLFAQAAAFYSALPAEIDNWFEPFAPDERVGFAASRRRLLHDLLDRALDLVEVIGEATKGRWP